jgi:hypothetical protein
MVDMHDPHEPFDLERQIRAWRETISSDLAERGPEVIDELESHLRDDVEQFVRAGRTPAQAWEGALARLGESPKLAAEFRKSPPALWLPARAAEVLLALCAVVVAIFIASRFGRPRTTVLLASHVFTVAIGYGALLAVGMTAVAAAVARSLGSFGPAQSDAFRRTGARLASLAVGMTLLGIILGAVWAGAHLGRAWGWDARETGGACVLAWSAVLFSYLRWRGVSTDSAVVAGVVGNVVVALAWFGPPLMEARAADGALGAWHAPLLAAFGASQLACLYVALLPAGWLKTLRIRLWRA